MLGWSIIARAWRSAAKRAMTCALSMPGLISLERNASSDGLVLLGEEDDAHAALAEGLEDLVGPDAVAGLLEDRPGGCDRCGGKVEEAVAAGDGVVGEESFDLGAELGIAVAGGAEEGVACFGVDLPRLVEEVADALPAFGRHGTSRSARGVAAFRRPAHRSPQKVLRGATAIFAGHHVRRKAAGARWAARTSRPAGPGSTHFILTREESTHVRPTPLRLPAQLRQPGRPHPPLERRPVAISWSGTPRSTTSPRPIM